MSHRRAAARPRAGRDVTETGVARRIVTPRDCVFALALPTTRQEYDVDRGRRDKEFAGIYPVWERYRQEVAAPAQRNLSRMEKLGATVVRRITLGDFGRLFQREFAVIILMAHYRESGAIELADGFAEVDAVLEVIPRDAERILDLGACHPWPLTLAVRRRRRDVFVRMTDDKATPAIWLVIYHHVLRELCWRPQAYLRAVEKIILEVRKRTDG